jgi:predicted phosphodiesterase
VTRAARRVAVLSDVHGNAVALEAVLRELAAESLDVIVFGGDLTWGPLPEETLALVEPLRERAIFIRGNADRTLVEARDRGAETGSRQEWLLSAHRAASLDLLETFVEAAVVDVDGLGPTRFAHGSPRSDEEVVTYATPEPRMRALLEGVEERVLVTAHTHLQFDRTVVGVRSVNAGSVGIPYGGRPGESCWALLGPDVDFRQTPYDLDEAARRFRESGDPDAERTIETLRSPPTAGEIVEYGERLEFAG